MSRAVCSFRPSCCCVGCWGMSPTGRARSPRTLRRWVGGPMSPARKRLQTQPSLGEGPELDLLPEGHSTAAAKRSRRTRCAARGPVAIMPERRIRPRAATGRLPDRSRSPPARAGASGDSAGGARPREQDLSGRGSSATRPGAARAWSVSKAGGQREGAIAQFRALELPLERWRADGHLPPTI